MVLGGRALALGAVTSTLVLTSCVSTKTSRCGDLVCPAETVCVPTLGQCYTEDAVAVCRDKADGDQCTGVDIVEGHCRLGVCVDTECGDEVVSGSEDCEGDQIGSASCESLNFYGGALACGVDCKYNTSSCVGFCGDGVRNGPEECDDADVPATSCIEFGFDAGKLSCSSICSTSFSTCERFGWSIKESGTGAYFEELWGMTSDDYYGVGRGGDFRHNDGEKWTAIQLASTFNWRAIDGSSADNAWAVGVAGQAARLEATGWALADIGASEDLYDVAVLGDDDVWVVGANATVRHFDGNQWSAVDIGADAGGRLKAIDVAGQLIAIGGRTNAGPPVVHLFDGQDWNEMPPVGGFGPIKAIKVIAADDIWVAQRNSSIAHWDGNQWTPIPLFGSSSCHDIHYKAANNIYVACGGFTLGRPIYHFDGSDWAPLEWDHFGSARTIVDFGDRMFAAGARGVAATFTGRGYIKQTAPTLSFTSVSALSRTKVFASHSAGVAVFNGSTWTNFPLGELTRAVSAIAPNLAFASGSSGNMYRFDGNSWQPDPMPVPINTQAVVAIDSTGPSNVWAMSSQRQLAHWDGIGWTPHSVTLPSSSTALVTFGASDVWAGSFLGGLTHFDGQIWSVDTFFASISNAHIRALGGSASTDLYAGTDAGLYHNDGTGWAKVDGLPDANAFYRWIDASAASDVYVAVNVGTDRLYHFDGSDWTRVRARLPLASRGALAGSALVITDGTDVDILADVGN